VRTASTRAIYIQLLSQTAADQADRTNQITISLYLGMLLMLLIWTVTRYFFHPDRLVVLLTLRFALAIGQGMVGSGLARLIMSSMQIDVALQHVIANTAILLSAPVSLLCDLLMLREFEPSRRLWQAAIAVLSLWPIALLFVALDQLSVGLQINNAYMIVMPIMFVALAWTARVGNQNKKQQHKLLSRRVLQTSYALILITGLPVFLSSAGFDGLPSWLVNLPVLYTVLSGIIFVLITLSKERAQQSMLQETAVQVRLAEQASATERARREEQERFLDMLAHEIKNPLAALRTIAENRKTLPANVDKIQGLVSDIDSVIRLCVQSGRLEQGKFERLDRDCDVGGLIIECRDRSDERPRIRCDLEPLLSVRTDPRLLKIILENLLDNAVKYSASGSPIDVTARRSKPDSRDGVAIEIANLPGRAGFPDPAQVFDKFYRHPSARSITGSGLGLYLVHEISGLLDATIDYAPDSQYIRLRLWLAC
jgi:signal transduction histidine kinase